MAARELPAKRQARTKPRPITLPGGRIPPHSLEMERAALCSALIDPNGMSKVDDILEPASFYDRRHQIIFEAMKRLGHRSLPIDILTVSEDLRTAGQLEDAGGDTYLAELSMETATSAHAATYARVIQDHFALRELIYHAARITEEAYESPKAEELLDRAMAAIFEITSSRKTGGFQQMEKVAHAALDYIDRLYQRQDTQLTGIGTGFTKLDDLTGGFQNGELIIVAARPSMGKTALGLDMARNAALRFGKGVGFFSLEMASIAICLRMLSAASSIEHNRIRNARGLNQTEFARVADAAGKLSEMNFHIDDTGNLNITELRARARRLKQQHNIDIIFIDYLQLMQPPKADNREQEVAQISRALKGLARELDIPVVAMSQLSRAVEHRGGEKIPQLADLRDSGAIEQDADVVMFIHRESYYMTKDEIARKADKEGKSEEEIRNAAGIILRKQRNGPTGEVDLIFNNQYTRFDNKIDPAQVPDYVPAPASRAVREEEAPF
ncbi:MAG: replicative DNA helicase [Calditrichaeota bacterium]|nr:replicative DNA helicase [Calditrichota bacterium]